MYRILLIVVLVGLSIGQKCQSDYKMQNQKIDKVKTNLNNGELSGELGDWVQLKPFFDLTKIEHKVDDKRVKLMIDRLIPLAT